MISMITEARTRCDGGSMITVCLGLGGGYLPSRSNIGQLLECVPTRWSFVIFGGKWQMQEVITSSWGYLAIELLYM